MRFFQLINGVMTSDEGAYPHPSEWALRADAEREITKGHRAVILCMEAEDRERRLAEQLIRAEKERDIVVGILTQARCYIDSPRFDEEGKFTGMVDDILRKMP